MLSKDVKFADLGLLIIDEEQRFGVKHKERLLLRSATDQVFLKKERRLQIRVDNYHLVERHGPYYVDVRCARSLSDRDRTDESLSDPDLCDGTKLRGDRGFKTTFLGDSFI